MESSELYSSVYVDFCFGYRSILKISNKLSTDFRFQKNVSSFGLCLSLSFSFYLHLLSLFYILLFRPHRFNDIRIL